MNARANLLPIDIAPGGGRIGVARQDQLDARVPLLLLPVNIETRFMDVSERQPQLWVRIYPDQIAINAHEPELTQNEIDDGATYWDVVWRAGNPPANEDDVRAAWRGLAARYGSQRAAWVALTMTPTNIAQQPAAPTPAGAQPVPAPAYPQPAKRDSSWEKPPIADALPDAWTVLLYSQGVVTPFRSGPVTPKLAVSLTPNAGAFPAGSPVDEGMKWIVDFEAAVQAGMALKIPLTPEQRSRGIDRIFVYGLRVSDKKASDTFAALLDAHHYTDGLALVPQGAPTNNTSDSSSAYSRKDPDYNTSFAVERQKTLTASPDCDGVVFANLLGIATTLLDHVQYADNSGVRNGTDMLTALWAPTLGYFMDQMMQKVFTPAQTENARQYALAHTVPRGPLPALRIGKTPYGVLPTTSLRSYQVDDRLARLTYGTIEPALVNFLRRLWPTWLDSAQGAPHVGGSGDPDKDLMAILGMDASSMSFRGRRIFGDDFLWNVLNLLAAPSDFQSTWWEQHLIRGRQLLNSYGYNQWDPRVIHEGMAERSFPVKNPTVQSGPLSETEPLKDDASFNGKKVNYITWLRSAAIEDIQADNYPGPKPAALLYKILRQSMLLDYVNLASGAEVNAGRLQYAQLREQEIIGVQKQVAEPGAAEPPANAPVSPWEILARPAIPNPKVTWAEYLVSLDPPPESPFARLAAVRASMDRLATLPTAELDRLLTETLDACSHRLDVWVTTVATAILKRARAGQVQGIHLGCFGWVEAARPGAQREVITGVERATVEQLDERRRKITRTVAPLPVPFAPLQDNGGYIHAPSLEQAAVAAVLRNGYMTHKGTSEEGLLSIDLSSNRVRKALSLIDGVQQGQSLSALLGYLFERGLHDLHLDKYAQPFRDRFPIVGTKLTPSSDPSESVAASNVVDGIALRNAWDRGALPLGGDWGTGLPGPGNSGDQNLIIGLFKNLDDYADALADASIAESVFQIIRGNFGRAGGLMNAISKGLRPPNPDVVNTPRGGLDLTHRVALLCAGNPVIDAKWAGVTNHPRAAAEPWLNAWASSLLPDPSKVRCQISYKDNAGSHTSFISLLGVDVGPLDALALADAADVPQRSELEDRILFAAAIPAAATDIKIDFTRDVLPASSTSFPDFLVLARAMRSLIGGSRALLPQDLALPEKKAEDNGGVLDLAELKTRAAAALLSLKNDVAALLAAVPGLPAAPGPVRTALLKCSFYGPQGAIPRTSSGADPGLADQATTVLSDLQKRIRNASAVVMNTADDVLSVLHTVFGKGFVVLPRFTPPDFASLQAAFAKSGALVASDPQAPSRWLLQLTQVRRGVSRLDAAYSAAQLLSPDKVSPIQFLLGQLPVLPNDRWLGLSLDPNNLPPNGRVALACITAGNPQVDNSYSGLLIDEWPERIPSTKQSATVTFHFEEPKARAPQTLLLAVCPDNRESWDEELIRAILEDTLDLAKIRTVDLDSVQQVGQILPALYFAFNLQGATVSTKFGMMKEVSHVSVIPR